LFKIDPGTARMAFKPSQNMVSQDQALLAIMERDLKDAYQQEPPPSNGISLQLPQHFVTMLVAVRSLEELMLQWPRCIRDKACLLRGLLSHAGTLIVTYMGIFHLKRLPFGENKLCAKILTGYDDFMADLTSELEDVAESVKIFHLTSLREEGQVKHEQTLCSCELALRQALRVKDSRHVLQLLKFIDRVTQSIFDPHTTTICSSESTEWAQRPVGRSRYYHTHGRGRNNHKRWEWRSQ